VFFNFSAFWPFPCFFFTIIIIIIIILPHIFVRSISRRCLDQTLWNLVGISYAMWSCVRQPFWKNTPLPTQLHIAYDIPTRFHKVWSRHLREIERTKMWNNFGLLSSNFMKLCRNIHCGVWQLLRGWTNSKWRSLPW
jgi:hypothetical protein